MKTKPEDFQFFIDQLNNTNPDELKRGLQSDHEQSEAEYLLFTKSFSQGDCYLCSEKITRCDYNKPCVHWLLRTHKRIKKKHIEQALRTKDLFQIIAYLRWVANFEAKLKNVNDFEAYEERKDLVYQETIRYGSISLDVLG